MSKTGTNETNETVGTIMHLGLLPWFPFPLSVRPLKSSPARATCRFSRIWRLIFSLLILSRCCYFFRIFISQFPTYRSTLILWRCNFWRFAIKFARKCLGILLYSKWNFLRTLTSTFLFVSLFLFHFSFSFFFSFLLSIYFFFTVVRSSSK